MVHVVKANMDASVTTLSCSHIHNSIGSHVHMPCSHVPTTVLMLHQTILMYMLLSHHMSWEESRFARPIKELADK